MSAIRRVRALVPRRWSKLSVLGLGLLLSAACPSLEEVEQPAVAGEGLNLPRSASGTAGGVGAACAALLDAADPGRARDCGERGGTPRPPALPSDLPCVRDAYVAAAVNRCWAAECQARLGRPSQAATQEEIAGDDLANADRLCISAPSSGTVCTTEALHGCR